MRSIAVIGGDTRLGSRVVANLRDDSRVKRLVVLGARVMPAPGLEVHAVDLATADLEVYLDDVDVVIDCVTRVDPIPEVDLMERMTTATADNVMRACTRVGRVVLASTTSVYGAWNNNVIPLRESTIVRPNPGFDPATHAAEIERRWLDWANDRVGREVVILRIAPIVTPGDSDLLALLLAGRPPVVPSGARPLVQVVHGDDAAQAVIEGALSFSGGVFNIACDGALSVDEVAALVPRRFQIPLPEELLGRGLDALWRSGAGDVPAATLAYLRAPLAVSIDTAEAQGWSPKFTNAEAIQTCCSEAVYTLPPEAKRVVLGVGAGVGALVLGVALAYRRRRRRARR